MAGRRYVNAGARYVNAARNSMNEVMKCVNTEASSLFTPGNQEREPLLFMKEVSGYKNDPGLFVVEVRCCVNAVIIYGKRIRPFTLVLSTSAKTEAVLVGENTVGIIASSRLKVITRLSFVAP